MTEALLIILIVCVIVTNFRLFEIETVLRSINKEIFNDFKGLGDHMRQVFPLK